MIFVFQVRYSGWPCAGPWAACVERNDIKWCDPYIEVLIDDVTSAGDAHDASKEILRRCYVASGSSPEDAVSNLMKDERSNNEAHY